MLHRDGYRFTLLLVCLYEPETTLTNLFMLSDIRGQYPQTHSKSPRSMGFSETNR